ncbi:hypothetical protein RA264_27980, partial [Pseudomonas syringae pv. tagetis]|uniref:hypothetical protein n=1 Tax=Pseudomonas syringae group genomosp. 7 TaxID=251699 RepID=UPI00376F72FF
CWGVFVVGWWGWGCGCCWCCGGWFWWFWGVVCGVWVGFWVWLGVCFGVGGVVLCFFVVCWFFGVGGFCGGWGVVVDFGCGGVGVGGLCGGLVV